MTRLHASMQTGNDTAIHAMAEGSRTTQRPGKIPCSPLWLTAVAIAGVLLVAGPAFSAPAETLVPASNTQVMDSQGHRWDINQYGAVGSGTNSVFSGALYFTINGYQIPSRQLMISSKTGEFVASGNLQGLQVTRRIKIDTKTCGARFADLILNPGQTPVAASVVIQTSFNSNFQMLLSDLGTAAGTTLSNKESGVVVLPHPSNNWPAVLFLIGGPAAKVKAAINNQNNYQLQFNYSLTLGPGKSVALVHTIAQRYLTGPPDVKTLAKLFQPFRSPRWVQDLPTELRRSVVNLGGGSVVGADLAKLLRLDDLGVQRGATDVLAVGEDTRLRGSAACAELRVETPYGQATIPFEKVAAVVGAGCGLPRGKVLLRDGQILSGRLIARGFRFTMDNGITLDLDAEAVDRLVARVGPEDGKPSEEARAYLETVNGDRIAVVGDMSQNVTMAIPWGTINVKTDDVLWLRPLDGGQPGHRIRLKDGTRSFGYLTGPELSLQSEFFGQQKVGTDQVRSFTSASIRPDGDTDSAEPSQPHVVLVGDNVLLGQVDLAELHFTTPAGTIPVPPTQLKRLHNELDGDAGTPGENPLFSGEIWGGGTVAGHLRETVIPIRSRDRVYQVPARDILDVRVPSAQVPDAVRAKIALLIRDLGHPEWEKRDTASRELAEQGHMAKRQLTEAYGQTTDPEVRRRVKALLDGMD